jgi:molybdate transport system substrate-binding protein
MRPLGGLFAAVLALVALGWANLAQGGETQVAVATNFSEPAKEIAVAFQEATGHVARLSFGASGQFYSQIANGAPYQVFLSADEERPAKAEAEGLAVKGTRFTYAIGRLVLYSKTPGLVDSRGQVLARGKFDKVAIADPATAPYGAAAVESMKKRGVYARLQPKLVQGSSIAQTFQFVQTGAAELGFVALSQVVTIKGGSRWVVPAQDHAPIVQQAVLLTTGAGEPAARAFLDYLKNPPARAIIKRYGYETR